MNVLITGSEGFIGTHLKERLLSEGHGVMCIDDLSHPCKFRHGHFINDSILNIEKHIPQIKLCDKIVHLAAQINVENSLENPQETLITNTLGTLKMLEISRQLGIPMIFASSTEIYGDKKSKTMGEDHIMEPKSPYAASKLGADGLCKAYYHSYGTKVIIVRNFNTFGTYQSDDKWGAVIAKFADRLINNKPPIIFGDGKQKRDFMSYKDAIDFYMLCLNREDLYGQEFNVGMGKNISILELAQKMMKLYGVEGIIEPEFAQERPGEVIELLCNNKKARSLGWKPNTNIDNLLREYIEWKLKYDNPRN
jgi:nucleoside-diphosphate-sugar epimerase